MRNSRLKITALLGLLLAAAPSRAAIYTFNFPTGASAETEEGEGIHLRGAGKFDTKLGTASGGGAFTIYNAFDELDGPIYRGTWTVSGFESFAAQGGSNHGSQGGILKVTILVNFGGADIEAAELTITCPFIDGAFDEPNDAIAVSLSGEEFVNAAGGFVAFHLDRP
jgi:hypothetical protein